MLLFAFCKTILLVAIWFISSVKAEPNYEYNVIETVYHNKNWFLEGFLFLEDGNILESIGLSGQSKVILYDIFGNELVSIDNVNKEFAEGITIFNPISSLWPNLSRQNNFIAQLTYKAKKIHFYYLSITKDGEYSLESIGTASMPNDIKEGWGLTSTADGKHLILGDGSSSLYFLEVTGTSNSLDVSIIHSFTVHDCLYSMSYIKGLNELELVPSDILLEQDRERKWQNPFLTINKDEPIISNTYDIWANIIGTWCVAIIDIKTGQVKNWLNLKNIDSDFTKFDRVANGIAYRYLDGSIWISGKKWKKSYKIKLNQISNEKFHPDKECVSPWRSQVSKYKQDNCQD